MKAKRVIGIFLFMSMMMVAAGVSAQDEKPLKDFQISMFPLIGTDGSQVLEFRYRTSLNIFAGVNGGVEGCELAGFLNINQGKVQGVQLAGFGNVVNGDVKGIQGAGFINLIAGDARGISGSGFANVVKGNHKGVLGTGFVNVVNGKMSSLAGAGFMNVYRQDAHGMSGAGFMNVCGGSVQGLAGAGFMNLAGGDSKGFYGAGFGNVTGGLMDGVSAAGFMNVSRELRGIQVAGFINITGRAEGVQIGFFNIADTIKGIPIGFLSFVKRGGLRHMEFSVSDALLSGSFKIGVPSFYNIFSGGFRAFGNNKPFTGFGYGLGTRITAAESSFIHLEGHTTHLRPHWNRWETTANFLNELRTTFNYSIAPTAQLFVGITLYNHVFRADDNYSQEDLQIAEWTLDERTYRNWTSQVWVGGRGGLIIVMP
jgi:hypothetical protein